MHWTTSRVVEWKEIEAQVTEIPIEGIAEGSRPENCEPSYALVYAGHGRTGPGGSWTTFLPAISCLAPAPGGNRRPSIVATPTSDGTPNVVPRPFLLVATVQGASVTVWSYLPNGEIEPNVEFSWHCIVEGTLVGAA